MDTTKITVLLFGIAKEIVGKPTLEMAIPEPFNVDNVKRTLQQQYPEFNKLKSLLIAVNQQYVNPDTLVTTHDEIAVIPPVSGG